MQLNKNALKKSREREIDPIHCMYQSTICWEGETRLTNTITSPDQQSLCLMTFKPRLEKTQGSKQELKEAICWG